MARGKPFVSGGACPNVSVLVYFVPANIYSACACLCGLCELGVKRCFWPGAVCDLTLARTARRAFDMEI